MQRYSLGSTIQFKSRRDGIVTAIITDYDPSDNTYTAKPAPGQASITPSGWCMIEERKITLVKP